MTQRTQPRLPLTVHHVNCTVLYSAPCSLYWVLEEATLTLWVVLGMFWCASWVLHLCRQCRYYRYKPGYLHIVVPGGGHCGGGVGEGEGLDLHGLHGHQVRGHLVHTHSGEVHYNSNL